MHGVEGVSHTTLFPAAGADRHSTRRQLRCVPGLTACFEALLAAVKKLQPFVCIPTAGDIGREQLSEAVIGYNDLERAKVRQRPTYVGPAVVAQGSQTTYSCRWSLDLAVQRLCNSTDPAEAL